MGVALAIGAGAAVSAAGSIFSGLMGASGAKKSADAIRYAAEVGSQTALKLNAQSRADLQPFRDLGVKSGGMLSDLFSGKSTLDELFKSSSLYNFESEMGTRALNRQLASRGQFGSGAGLESLALFDKSLVAEQGNDYFTKLLNTTTLGSNAAAQQATNTTQTGNTVANLQAQAGQNRGQAYQTQYNAYGVAGSGGLDAIHAGLNNAVGYKLYGPVLQRLANGGSSLADMGFGANQFTEAQQRDSLATFVGR